VRVFGELETVVMARLWDLGGDATVREVLERIQLDREIAYTTVLSTMENLHRKGHLTRERRARPSGIAPRFPGPSTPLA